MADIAQIVRVQGPVWVDGCRGYQVTPTEAEGGGKAVEQTLRAATLKAMNGDPHALFYGTWQEGRETWHIGVRVA